MEVMKEHFDFNSNMVLKQPLLKQELFTTAAAAAPVITETLELIRDGNSFLCRVRSKDGAEGISVGHSAMRRLYPIFLSNLQPFFMGQDARELDLLLERVYIYGFNFRYNGLPLGIPLATIEHAILDMLGKIANKSVGQLIGEIYHPEVSVYMATEFRHLPLEEHFERIKETVDQYNVNALKIKVGYQHASTTDIHYAGLPGKSEKLIPLVREHYGDDFSLYADPNRYYDVDGAIKIGSFGVVSERLKSIAQEPPLPELIVLTASQTDAVIDFMGMQIKISIPWVNAQLLGWIRTEACWSSRYYRRAS